MSNGTIPEKDQTSGREITALFLLVLGLPMFIGGVGMLFGWGGVLLVLGALFTGFGVLLGFTRTGKE